MKKKVLVWADTPNGSTGFSTVSKNILKEMYATGEYEFDCVAINGTGLPYDRNEFPYMIYPAISALAQDPKFRDPYGRHLMLSFLSSGNYDLLFIIQDTFIVQTVVEAINTTWEKLPKEKKFATIYYFPIDATPHRDWVTKVVSACHYPVAYTEYAKRECMKFDPSLKRMPVIYHGANEYDFHPLTEEERKAFRKSFFKGKEDDFIVLNVSRNQPRKDLHKTFAAFSIFHKDHPDSFLYILAQCQDVGGDLIEIAKNYGLEYEVDWGCPAPGTYGANSGYPVEMVNKIYASSDLGITTSLGEGFGLMTTEIFRTKTPIIVPRNTSLVEIIGQYGERGFFCDSGATLNDWVCLGQGDNNLIRPTVDVYDLARQIEFVYSHPEDVKGVVEAAFAWVPSWKKVCEQWKDVFSRAYRKVEEFRK